MGRQKIRKERTIFQQFIIAFLGIVTPIMLFGLLLILWQTNIIREETEEKAKNDLYYKMKYLNNQIQMVENQQDNLMNAEEIQQFVRYSGRVPVYEYYTLANEVKNRMEIEQMANECIEDISIYVKESDVSISTSAGYSHPMAGDYRVLSGSWNGKRVLSFDMHEISMLLAHPLLVDAEESSYILKVTLSREKVFQEYLLNDLGEDNYIFLYDHREKQLLYMPREGIDDAAELLRFCLDSGEPVREIAVQGKQYFVMAEYSDYLKASLYLCIPRPQFMQAQNRIYVLLSGYLLLCIAFAILFLCFVKHIVNRPVYQLMDALQDVEQGNFDKQIFYHAADEFNYLYSKFNHMVKRLKRLIDENYKSMLYAQQAELKQMQAQISPHFLYNTYFMLHRMIQDEDLEDAARLSEHLGNYMEYVTHNFQEEVPLEKEVAHVRSYLNIQVMRFGKRMQVQMEELPQELSAVCVPRLILQPVVENYVKYGYETSGDTGVLVMAFEMEKAGFRIIISGGCAKMEEQTLQELEERLSSEDDTVELTGLINIHRRLKLKFGEESGIYLQRDEEERLITCLSVNYKVEEDDV